MYKYYAINEKYNFYLDDEPLKTGTVKTIPSWERPGWEYLLSCNGEAVRADVVHWEWQKEQEYDIFMYSL